MSKLKNFHTKFTKIGGVKLGKWTDRSQVDMTKNSNQFSKVLSHY